MQRHSCLSRNKLCQAKKAKVHTIERRRKAMRKYEDKMFEKISVKKTAKKQKRDEWKRERKLQRKVKHARQEKVFA